MADAEASHQLVEGFYSIEESAWRWTAKRFTVDLAAPPTAKEKGATLRFKLTLPEAAFKEYKSVAVSAKLDGLDIPAKKFAKVGDHEFVAEIPATSLQSDKVRVEFSLDKSFLPGSGDQRELGIVARHIGLEPKELGLTTK